MGTKIQGEGDYESAKRFNKMEQDFVKRKYGKRDVDQAIDDDTLAADDDTEIAENEEIRRLRRMENPSNQRR